MSATPGCFLQDVIHWLSWDRLSVRKEKGGLGFRDLYGFNLAMLGRQGWSFISSSDTLASRIFKARYFLRGDFLTAQLGHNPSCVWKSVWSSRSLLQIGCRWKIGNGTKINTWNDPWLREANNFRVQTSMISGYWVASEIMLSNMEFRTSGECQKVWNLQIPPKVKTFLWRSIRNCLPVRAILQHKGIRIPLTYVHCEGNIENTWHAFLLCPFAQECWNESHLSHAINSCATQVDSFAEMIFLTMNTFTNMEVGKSVMIMWGLWKQRNDKLWNNKHCTSSQLVYGALQTLYDWLQAKVRGPLFHTNLQRADPVCKRWHKPPPHFLKCNTDAAIFTNNNTFGLSCALRDENGELMACRVQHGPRNPLVKECEALALLNAITWIKEMNLANVIFELDAKIVVDAIKSVDDDATEFGSLVHQCRRLLDQGTSFSVSFSVQFVYRQATVAADALAKAAHFYASPYVYFETPPCLFEHLDDYCNSLHD